VPVALSPEGSNSQTEAVAPVAAVPLPLVCSPSFVQVPLPPVTEVTSLLSPSVVDVLSDAIASTAKRFAEALIVFVTVVRLNDEVLVALTPVPPVPTLAIATV